MAVAPGNQNRGIGSRLVEQGVSAMDDAGCPFVIVLGHPEYYRRFGFEEAGPLGIRCQWPDIPTEAFMIRGRTQEALPAGEARYHSVFEEL